MPAKSFMGALPQCSVTIPDETTSLHDLIPRWSHSGVGMPAIVVQPQTEHDVVASIEFAQANSLVVVPAGGGHAPFLPIGSKTLYLEMVHFKSIRLDKSSNTASVKLGGGVTTGEVLRTLADEGYYTTVPNVNAVGVVGAVLGGGNTVFGGAHGMMIDNVVSIRLVAADGRILDVSASSAGEEKALFNTLCGAGHGLGVITALTMKAYPIVDLGLTNGKVWVRRLVFPPSAIQVAATTLLRLHPTHPRLAPSLVFLRTPPSAPFPGAPLAVLTAIFFGSSDEAEKLAAPLLDPEVANQSVVAETAPIEFAKLNDGLEPTAAHGGYKDISSCLISSLDAETIVSVYRKWLAVGDENPGAIRTSVVISSCDTMALVNNGRAKENAGKFYEQVSRSRPFTGLVLKWCTSQEAADALSGPADEIVSMFRVNEQDAPRRTIVNNMRLQMRLEDHFEETWVKELRRVKEVWDGHGAFWSPYVQ